MTSAEDFQFICRLLLERRDGSEESRFLLLNSISKTGKNQAKAFHPMMLKIFSESFIPGGNVLPSIYIDFGQWQEDFTLDCYVDQLTYPTAPDQARYLSNLRTWIIKNNSISTNKWYLQLFYGDTSVADPTQKVHMDAQGVPILLGVDKGFRGIPLTVPEFTWKAGQGTVDYKLRFGVGVVLP